MKLLYLMGAGRSGTTLLATLLGGADNGTTLGEMHQFLDHVLDNKPCSCGLPLHDCEFWSPIVEKLSQNYSNQEITEINELSNDVEAHRHIVNSAIGENAKYVSFQEDVVKIIQAQHKAEFYVDSSKYISRMLQLKRSKNVDMKAVYLVRDVRGVIHSFGKQVQTPKDPLATIVYYSLINFFGQLIAWRYGKKRVLKLRYEDLVSNAPNAMRKIANFAEVSLDDVITKLEDNEAFLVPHIVGGNRLVQKQTIQLKEDLAWKDIISRPSQLLYYLLTLPSMLLNRYTP